MKFNYLQWGLPFLFFLVSILDLLDVVLGNKDIIDTKFPIVINGNGEGRQRVSGNYGNDTQFGYSMAFMRGYLGDTTPLGSVSFEGQGDARATIFIGAPNETRFTKNFGVVWQCEFDGEASKVSCGIHKQVSEQSSPPEETTCNKPIRKNHYFSEDQTQQWIGASLSVNPTARQLLACAPRWKINGYLPDSYRCLDESAMPGACYLSEQNGVHELNPLNQPNHYYYNYPGDKVSEFLFIYSEFGFSSHYTPSGNLFVGAPSVRNWMGSMVEIRQPRPIIHMDIHGIDTYSYHGYTLTSGRNPAGGYYLASGAPRAKNLYGAVTVSNPASTKPFAIYEGNQYGGYFGYALATVDLNGDGYDELLVGAPMYTPESKTGAGYSTGCVLIFDLKLLRIRKTPIEPKLCMDTQQVSTGSRFGSAIANIGDINFDNQKDFAISAPYDDDGFGTIFIYHGGFPLSKHAAQIIRGKSLNIPNLHGFGTYLLGGEDVDIDGNKTPDLVIGAFESRHVVVLRTRPVAKPSMEITFHKSGSRGHEGLINKRDPTQTKFRVRCCVGFFFSIRLPSDSQKLDALMKFELDPKFPQVQFEDPADQTEQRYTLFSSQESCVDKELHVEGEIDASNADDYIRVRATLRYNQTETTENQIVQHASVMLSSSPNQQQSSRPYSQAYDSFNAYLPAPIPLTQSKWGELSIAADNCDSGPECDPELKFNSLKLYYEDYQKNGQKEWTTGKKLVVGQLESLIIKMEVTNKKETAYRPTVRITLDVSDNLNMKPRSLQTIWEFAGNKNKPQLCGTEYDNPAVVETQMYGITRMVVGRQCSKALQYGQGMVFHLRISNLRHLSVSNSKNGNKGRMTLKVEAFPEARQQDRVIQRNMSLDMEANVDIEVKSTIPMQNEIDRTLVRTGLVAIGQFYTITNTGFTGTSMEAVVTEILIPTRVNFKANNWTQVIGVADPSTPSARCEASNFEFFVLPSQSMTNKQTSSRGPNDKFETKSRSTRNAKSSPSGSSPSLKVVSPEKVSVTESDDKYLTLSGCEGGRKVPPEQSCQKIICHMDLPSKMPRDIKIQMYVLRNALGELVKAETTGIRVKSMLSVFYQGKKVKEEMGKTQIKFALPKGISALVLLGAGAGGTLLFILITFALFKCGFFRRKTKEQLQVLKRQTMQMDQRTSLLQDTNH